MDRTGFGNLTARKEFSSSANDGSMTSVSLWRIKFVPFCSFVLIPASQTEGSGRIIIQIRD
jgi:hypothetical protein